MVTRLAAALLSLALIPGMTIAQIRGNNGNGQASQSHSSGGRVTAHVGVSQPGGGHGGQHGGHTGGGFGTHMGGGFATGGFGVGTAFGTSAPGLAPQLGYGNINHPGLGFAPNTPGIGFPVTGIQPLPLITQPLPGVVGPINSSMGNYGGYRRGSYYRHNNNVVVIPVPVFVGGYSAYDTYSYTSTPVSPAPTVVIIEQGAQTVPNEGNMATRVISDDSQRVYEVRPGQQRQTTGTLTLLVFKDHSIYAVSDYWKDGDNVTYITSYGAQNTAPIEQLDLPMTVRLNAERNVTFELRERK